MPILPSHPDSLHPSGDASALRADARNALTAVADHNGFGNDAVVAMWQALLAGGGSMAQFDHAEFGGSGQWMRGGMTMVSNLFDTAMRDRVDALGEQLARALDQHPEWARITDDAAQRAPAGPGLMRDGLGLRNWWPRDLNNPASTGAQNGMRYAYFPEMRRLAIDRHGEVRVFDTGDHAIGGVCQQQGSQGNLAFTSQHGAVDLLLLQEVSVMSGTSDRAAVAPDADIRRPQAMAQSHSQAQSQSHPARTPEAAPTHASAVASVVQAPPSPATPMQHYRTRSATATEASVQDADALLATIDKMADLHQRGVLTSEEFAAKKAELLSRI